MTENFLRHETSPYLLQHADNPVHWRPWGAAALAEAKVSDRPILLSIGYAACHWCHVMAHESFEDDETAALMNSLYVNIKIDREERPDIDHLYMQALHQLGEQGGWPLTMFLTPDGAPFWGGTYFPPEPRWGRPSFRQVLVGIEGAYRNEGDKIAKNVAALTRALHAIAAENPGALPTPATLSHAVQVLLRTTDPVLGGMKGAPKFPNPPIFRFLWQDSFRTGDQAGADAVHLLLRRMSQGGIYDHLGGGYSRYSTDAEWLAPHFEKMLYDNAQILDLLASAHAARPTQLTARRIAETITWMVRDMTAATVDGHAAFAASEDADSEGVEGKFYVWTETEVDALLGPASQAFKTAYDVTPDANWEGHTILRRNDDGEDSPALAASRDILLAARNSRIRPGRDDKVLADWNGLAIAALAKCAAVFSRPDWLAIGQRTYAFVRANMAVETPDGLRVAHAWRLGRVTAAGLLDDHAALARAALALHEATGTQSYLTDAIAIVQAAEAWFAADGEGSYFTTASDATDIPLGPAARPRIVADNATPAGNGVMAEVLARLYHLTGDTTWRRRAEALLIAFGGLGDRLAAAPTLLAAADLLEAGATIVVAGPPDAPATLALIAAALGAPDPAVMVLRAPNAQSLPPTHPAFGKAEIAGQPAAYLCRGNVCGLPVTDPAMLANQLRSRQA